MNGVVKTRVGYAGGTKDSPTYRNMGDHSESIRIEFDPKKISYEQLLDTFWKNHSPGARALSSQYMSIIFYHDEEQKRMAEQSKRLHEARLGAPVHTVIAPAADFAAAEDYHQKYYLRNNRILNEQFEAIYPDPGALVDSTAAARINGYLGGYGSLDSLREILPNLGLSEKAGQELLKKAGRR